MPTNTIVTGPVAGGWRGWPFSLPLTDLASVGYVAEEFFLDGTAAAYEAEPGAKLTVDGKWRVRPSRTAPFRTRVLVVRPVDRARFNGIVHVNWQNVTAGFELGIADFESEQLLDGFAWVGVSAQRVGVHGFPGSEQFALRGWDPERYGTLDHPGDDFSFDIYTLATRSIGPEMLGGAGPRKLVATGASQSAIGLRTYANAIQPMEQLFDGFFLLLDFGRGALPDTRGIDTATLPAMTVPVRIRDDLGVPALVFNSETEAPWLFPVRQPDTDTVRLWEVAGTSHRSGAANEKALAPLFARDGIMRAPGRENPNVLSYTPAYRAAFHHMNTWLEGGPPPPPKLASSSSRPTHPQLGATSTATRLEVSGSQSSRYRQVNTAAILTTTSRSHSPVTAGRSPPPNCMSATPTATRTSANGRTRSTAASPTGSSCPRTPPR
jgi:Alpha/beta hydrolase domain